MVKHKILIKYIKNVQNSTGRYTVHSHEKINAIWYMLTVGYVSLILFNEN